ncbi:outer membrane protein assembly factor BamB family protein [Nocardiopsis sp. M1B1]|uniref:outer membrane protein assembly factor BamB family protein n=1 Tax=Nocardiopsis sp. M1B1 TaxID=3450454 RepID=UPI004039F9D4
MDGAGAPERRRRVGNALAWAGSGLLAGALLLAAATVVRNWGRYEDGLLEETGGWWIPGVAVAGLALFYGIRWSLADSRRLDDEPEGRAYVVWLALAALGGVYPAVAGFPRDSFPATAETAWHYDPSPAAAAMWLVVCAVVLGCLLMLASVRPQRLAPLRRSLPSATAGALAVVLVSVLVGVTAFPREPHTTAAQGGDPPPVPETVSRVGWSWAPPMGTRIEEVHAGTHGPLVLLGDGAVSLDGETGEERWSFRRPRDHGRGVWADDAHVYVRYVRGDVPEGAEPGADGEPVERTTAVLDIATGEVTGEHTAFQPDGWGGLVAMTPEARIGLVRTGPGGSLTLSARALDGGEELWSRALAEADDGRACRNEDPLRYGDLLVTLHGCAPERQSRFGDHSDYESFSDLFSGENRVDVAVTAVDLTTGEEAWRHTWVTEPGGTAPEPVGGGYPVGEGDPVVVLEQYDADPPLRVLDAATGERIDRLPELVAGGDWGRDEDYEPESVVRADTAGGVLREDLRDGSLFHRVDASGGITATADAGDLLSGLASMENVVALEEAVVIPRVPPTAWGDERVVEVAVAPFGESVSRDTARWIVPEGQVLVDVLAVPGAVVVHTGEDEESLVEGLVP